MHPLYAISRGQEVAFAGGPEPDLGVGLWVNVVHPRLLLVRACCEPLSPLSPEPFWYFDGSTGSHCSSGGWRSVGQFSSGSQLLGRRRAKKRKEKRKKKRNGFPGKVLFDLPPASSYDAFFLHIFARRVISELTECWTRKISTSHQRTGDWFVAVVRLPVGLLRGIIESVAPLLYRSLS